MEKKKIVGIMSMQRVCNYGSFLQAYGLKKMIESLGHKVIFIDYTVGRPVENMFDRKTYVKAKIRNKLMLFASEFNKYLFFASDEQKYSLRFQYNYRHKYLKELGVSHKRRYREKVDTLVIGSDEVFNCLQANPDVGYSEELFGANANASRLISYAASFGNTTLDGIKKSKKEDSLKKLLGKFDAISVRDANSEKIIEKLTDKSVIVNMDPVLMYGFKDECLVPVEDKDYIVVYAYRNRIKSNEAEVIREFANKTGKKLISIGGYQGFCDKYQECTPFQVLAYIRNADYVVTDTFHGTIFSILGHRKFVTFIRNGHGKVYGNHEKLMFLLNQLGLNDRAIFEADELEKKIEEDINYDSVDMIIQNNRAMTREYLIHNI